MNAFDLETPSVYVDLDVLEHNVRSMQERCRGWGVGLRVPNAAGTGPGQGDGPR